MQRLKDMLNFALDIILMAVSFGIFLMLVALHGFAICGIICFASLEKLIEKTLR